MNFYCMPMTLPIVKNGFYTENGHKRLYLNDVMQKGLITYQGKKYYFNAQGNMVTGSVKIKNSYYYFASTGVMKKGFVKIKSKRYYYSKITGKKVFGYRKIGKYYYYFKGKSGAAATGFVTRKYHGTKILTYYNRKGQLKTGTFKVSNVLYKATKRKGSIYYVRNLAQVICQRPELPTGCEITSWTMMANYEGVKISKITAANVMPRSSNPNYGFMGSPYYSSGSENSYRAMSY